MTNAKRAADMVVPFPGVVVLGVGRLPLPTNKKSVSKLSYRRQGFEGRFRRSAHWSSGPGSAAVPSIHTAQRGESARPDAAGGVAARRVCHGTGRARRGRAAGAAGWGRGERAPRAAGERSGRRPAPTQGVRARSARSGVRSTPDTPRAARRPGPARYGQ
ncbi:hypothetical protein ACE1SV_74610 [Streptomyces sp. E-15]